MPFIESVDGSNDFVSTFRLQPAQSLLTRLFHNFIFYYINHHRGASKLLSHVYESVSV